MQAYKHLSHPPSIQTSINALTHAFIDSFFRYVDTVMCPLRMHPRMHPRMRTGFALHLSGRTNDRRSRPRPPLPKCSKPHQRRGLQRARGAAVWFSRGFFGVRRYSSVWDCRTWRRLVLYMLMRRSCRGLLGTGAPPDQDIKHQSLLLSYRMHSICHGAHLAHPLRFPQCSSSI